MLKFARNLLDRGAPKQAAPFIPVFDPPEPELGPDMTIGVDASVIGKIVFQREMVIEGVFEGELEGKGKVVIGPEGFVKADLDVEEAEISGQVEGNITVKYRLILRGNAKVKGNITAPRLSVEEGVSIIGQVCSAAESSEI